MLLTTNARMTIMKKEATVLKYVKLKIPGNYYIKDIFDKEIPISGNLSNEIFYSFYSYTFKFSGNSS